MPRKLPTLTAPMKRMLPLAIALVAALAAAVLVRAYLGSERAKLQAQWKRLTAEYRTPIDVVVAAVDLPADTPLQPSHVKLAQIPEKFAQPYAVRVPATLRGQVTLVPIAEGEQILSNKVGTPKVIANTLSDVLPEGKRAVTIASDEVSGVGGFIRPGDLVDMLWTVRLPVPGPSKEDVVTLVLFQDVLVLAVGPEMLGREAAPGATAVGKYTITVALTPQETSLLLLAREQGRVQLSLRSERDKDRRVAVAPANSNALIQYVLGEGAVPKPPEPPPPPKTVEVFRGLERNVISLSASTSE